MVVGSPGRDTDQFSAVPFRQRPYCVEHTRSHSNSEVKRLKARSVLGWGTAWEVLRVLLAFCFFDLELTFPGLLPTIFLPISRVRLGDLFFVLLCQNFAKTSQGAVFFGVKYEKVGFVTCCRSSAQSCSERASGFCPVRLGVVFIIN